MPTFETFHPVVHLEIKVSSFYLKHRTPYKLLDLPDTFRPNSSSKALAPADGRALLKFPPLDPTLHGTREYPQSCNIYFVHAELPVSHLLVKSCEVLGEGVGEPTLQEQAFIQLESKTFK